MKKSILIVDDSAPIRRFLRNYIERAPDCEVCGEARDGLEAVRKARELKPDLIVMDLSMPEMNGLEASTAIQGMMPDSLIILYTMHKDSVVGQAAQDAGITSVLSKTEDVGLLMNEVQRLLCVT